MTTGSPNRRQKMSTAGAARAADRLLRMAGSVSISTKILGIVLALTALLGAGVTWQVRHSLQTILASELDSRGSAVASDIAARSTDPILVNDLYALNELLMATVANHTDAIYAFVTDRDGNVLAHTFGPDGFPVALLDLYEPDRAAGVNQLTYRSGSEAIHDFRTSIFGGRLGEVRIGFSESRLAASVNAVSGQLLLTTAAVGVAGILAAVFLTWLLTRPILDLVSTTRRVGSGDLSTRAEVKAQDEIGSLATAFNSMVADLEASQTLIAEDQRVRKRLLEQLIGAQEEERKRIARELHDGVGQSLSSIRLGVSVLARANGHANQKRLDDLAVLADETLAAVRALGRDLRPSALDDLGLEAAMERHVEEFRSRYPEISVDLHYGIPDRADPAVEIALYRIFQEAMTNSARHSGCGTISVVASTSGKTIKAIVEDDGCGFDFEFARRSGSSVGIHGMAERAELLGGSVIIESGTGGTTVFIEVPA